MFSQVSITENALSSANFGLNQRIGTGPFSFMFDPTALSFWAGQASIAYTAIVAVVMAAAFFASCAEKRKPVRV